MCCSGVTYLPLLTQCSKHHSIASVCLYVCLVFHILVCEYDQFMLNYSHIYIIPFSVNYVIFCQLCHYVILVYTICGLDSPSCVCKSTFMSGIGLDDHRTHVHCPHLSEATCLKHFIRIANGYKKTDLLITPPLLQCRHCSSLPFKTRMPIAGSY